MRYCGPRGLPRSEFLGWSREDRDDALWWLIHEAQTCGGCGTRPAEWDPTAGGHPSAYQAVEVRCPGCALLEHHRERNDRSPAPTLRGTTVVLRRRETGGG